ncbi:uncharacterized protein LOC121735695 [Aricia agestis]|uniref:uncharacterized protein LOC121735695 n=1 Tax=Aricia agestis TaxID=91739 RepID=UPI001C20B44B|nr:uncharacterized protein LOC121735695 [Aricia agestis]
MADDNTIIEGTVKFRDGKKWKSRWCVMRKLSPVADCVHVLVYRDARARWGGASKASLSLQHYLGCEAGFTLDKHSHTLALICADFTAVLAFETRERLMQWQVKVSAQLGEARQYLVLVGAAGAGVAGGVGGRRLAAGPARLHLRGRRLALTAGVPPKLLGVWEIAHLRRYGVIDGRFCFEGGSLCGKGEGLHVLVTDQAAEIARDFDLASRGQLSPRRRASANRNISGSTNSLRKRERSFEAVGERAAPPSDLRLYSEGGEGAASPCWSGDLGLGDTASVCGTAGAGDGPWGGVALERCMSCISKLGALSRSSTAALTPGARHFAPAWTMDAVDEAAGEHPSPARDDVCQCSARPPERPPKPTRPEPAGPRKPPMPLPIRSFSHAHLSSIGEDTANLGPYENYDVPKIPSAEVDGEYYDTPKRLKDCMSNDLFKITKNSNPNTLILKKPCGCLLKFGKKQKQPTVIDTDESFQQASCPCQRVTDWANSWIRLPYCKSNAEKNDDTAPNKENLKPNADDAKALYATIDLSRKTRRKAAQASFSATGNPMSRSVDSGSVEIDDGPLANYENLSFALSLEHYENAKDLLRKAGVTQAELDALTANLRPALALDGLQCDGAGACAGCGPRGRSFRGRRSATDEYLLMEPNSLEGGKLERNRTLASGYTPMSPIGTFAFHTLKHPAKSPVGRLLEEKSASNPALCRPDDPRAGAAAVDAVETRGPHDRAEYRKRSSSADSSRFLEDAKEFAGSRGSSVETLRDIARGPTPCDCAKHSDADSSGPPPAGTRDSSSSNDSGVSSWSLRAGFELPATTAAARRRYRSARRDASPPPARRARSTPAHASPAPAAPTHNTTHDHKCCSAEAEVPVLTVKPLRGVADTHSTSSGTSDMSDYIETLSICSSHSSSDTPVTMRVLRQTTSTLRPRSGKEYRPHPHLYTDLP